MGSCLSAEENGRKDRRRDAKEVLATEALNDQRLALATGRICCNGASSTASLFTQQGRKGVNQDAMIVWEGFCSRKDSTFCAVFDGHGPYGHLVARRVRDSLPSKLVTYRQGADDADSKSLSDVESEKSLEENAEEAETLKVWKETHLKSYRAMDKELKVHPTIDCNCSGTTAVTILKQGDELVIGNVGDSRAIMGSRAEDNSLHAVQLTTDLKPNLPKEAERIRLCKGRVFALRDEPRVARVWMPNENVPGLAMARAFGDFCLKKFGLIAIPEMSYHRITERDQFVVLATDGVWDVLSNEEVVKIVASAPTRTTSARALVESAVRAWRVKYPTSKVDDCAVVCLYLNADKDGADPKKFEVAEDEAHPRRAGHRHYRQQQQQHHHHIRHDGTEQEITEVKASDKQGNVVAATAVVAKLQASKSAKSENGRSNKSLKECLAGDNEDDEDWSALEGVTRVNSLLTLPRKAATPNNNNSNSSNNRPAQQRKR